MTIRTKFADWRRTRKYRALKDGGFSAGQVCERLRADGVQLVERIRILRVLFDLDLADAKEVEIVADGKYSSLSQYQASLI